MRTLLVVLLSVYAYAAAVAQSHSISELSPLAGISFYSISSTSISGPTLGLQYVPNRYMEPALEFTGGVVLRFTDPKASLVANSRQTSEIAGFRSPLSNAAEYFSSPPPTKTGLAFGYGFFGTDVKVFLADGTVRPYLSAGVQLVLYSWYSPLTVAFAPDLRGGIDLRFSDDFTAFGEVRYAVGLPGTFSPADRAFDNATMVAFGFTFVPSFN